MYSLFFFCNVESRSYFQWIQPSYPKCVVVFWGINGCNALLFPDINTVRAGITRDSYLSKETARGTKTIHFLRIIFSYFLKHKFEYLIKKGASSLNLSEFFTSHLNKGLTTTIINATQYKKPKFIEIFLNNKFYIYSLSKK